MPEGAYFKLEVVEPGKPKVWLGGLTLRAEGDRIVIAFECDDCYYSFERPIRLGQLLSALGLTADDCGRAITEWVSTGRAAT